MFANPRPALLLVVLTMILAGALLAKLVINATTGRAEPNLTSAAAIAAATRSLPADRVIRPGDTFDSIAAQNHLSASQLQQLNPTQDARHPARRPAPQTAPAIAHATRAAASSASLLDRAANTGLRAADIAQLNPTVNPNALVPGQRLKLRP